jgi:uncharacterized protein (TIGR02271 family)
VISSEQIQAIIGSTAQDDSGSKIGKIGQIYLDDQTNEPAWATVNTGLFGTSESFVPLAQASVDGDTLRVPYSKDKIKDAPKVAADGHIEPHEEAELYRYYGLQDGYGTSDTSNVASGNVATDADRTVATDTDRTVGHDTSGPTTDDAMTRSEERLRVGTETREAGRARLRKYVVTENETVTVPVSREEVRVEREPITDANRDEALSGPAISEEEHEVVLHEERPVVTTEAQPVERVRMTTDTVTDQETDTEEVRKEQIDLDAGTEVRGDRR